jgi:hypothetical protein
MVQLMKPFRCILAALLLLVFGGGASMLPAQGGEMAVPAMEAMADQAMPDGCDRCDGSDMAMATGACAVLGTCLQAVMAPVELALADGSRTSFCYGAESISGQLSSPDPSPPKA